MATTAATLQTCNFAGTAQLNSGFKRLSHCHSAGVLRFRCRADGPSDGKAPVTQRPDLPSLQTQIPAPAIPKPNPKVSTKFSDILAFSGPAPERINGRLAMIGFVSAIAVELARGEDLMVQLMNGGLPLFAGTAAVVTAASLVPFFKGVRPEAETGGLMTPDAELWNGRFAMLGLVALAFTEYLKDGPIV